MWRLGLGLACLALAPVCAAVAQADDKVPQIMLTDAVLERINRQRARDPAFQADYTDLLARADSYLKDPPVAEKYAPTHPKAPSALPVYAGKLVEHLTTLGMAWRLTGETRYADRGRLELLAVSQLDNWYPAHFLGLSRASLAVGLGYSWFRDALSAEDRKVIRSALVKHALGEANRIYALDRHYFDSGWVVPQQWVHPAPVPKSLPDGTATANISWPVASFNWNILCNTGMIVAALAVSGDEPDLARQVIRRAQISVRNGFAMFAPDGAWPEGPMYGALSMRDAAVLVTALQSVLGHDFGLSKSVGMPSFGDYLKHVTGPTGLLFNYGDSDTHTDHVALSWMSTRFDRPAYDWRQAGAEQISHPAFNLIWRQSEGLNLSVKEPRSLWFGGLGLVTLRSAWDDRDAVYAGFKAGPLRSHHNNLDAGTFVLDAKGVRWAVDLGVGNYLLPGYFTDQRFDYYRTATIGQNTLTFEGANQDASGRAQIEAFGQFPGFSFAIADLSPPYDMAAGTVRRGIALIDDVAVLVQDEITGTQPEPVAWTMHTQAEVTLAGSRAVLRQGGAQMTVAILSPHGAGFTLRSARPCDTAYDAHCKEQNPNSGVQRLMIDLDGSDSRDTRRIAVAFVPADAKTDLLSTPVTPLSEWRLQATLARETSDTSDP